MPSADDLLKLFDDVKAAHQRALKEFTTDEEYITAPWDNEFGQETIPEAWEDEGLQVTVPPTVYNAVENASDHILTVPRHSVPVRPVAEGVEKQREIAESRRQFHDMFWHTVYAEQGDPLGRGKKSLIKGKLVLKKEIAWELLPELPDEPTAAQRRKFKRDLERVTRSNFPWRVTLVPKETVFEDLANPHDPSFCYEAYEVRVLDLRSRFRGNETVERILSKKDATARVEYVEYWSKPVGDDPGQYVQWIDREVIHEESNPYSWKQGGKWYGYVPYAVGDPGWGDVDAQNDPYDRYVSIVRPIRAVAKAETRFLTEMESYLRMYIWPHLLTRNMPDLEDGEKQIKLGPGGHTDMTEDQEADVLKWGELPVSLLQGMDRVNQYADEASRFGVLGGMAQRGVDTATEADQNVRNAATKLSGPVRTLRRMVTQINKWVLQDIEKVLEAPVTIYGATEHGPSEITLSPRDINGFYASFVEMETSDEASLNLRNARTWSDLYQRLPITAYTTLKKAGVPNPQAEIDERKIEDLEFSPQAMQVMLLMMLAGLGETGNLVQQAFQQSLITGGGQTPNGQQPLGPQQGQDAMQNPVQAMRTQARQDAQEAAPERAFY